MKLLRHKIAGMEFARARAVRGAMTPTLGIVHDTASRLTPLSAARYLQDNTPRVSVHFVVERDGATQQQVPTNIGANHAGTSVYHGQRGCNDFSIGMEIVNPGWMTPAGDGRARAWWGGTFDIDEYGIQQVDTPEHGSGRLWMPYTEAQIDTALAIWEAVFAGIPSMMDLRTHWYVSPGRKVDTNPLFPLEQMRARLLGREEPADLIAEVAAPPVAGEEWGIIDVPGDTLNLRRWPSFNPNVIAAIPHGTDVPVLARGMFDGREWTKVIYGGQEGWIVSRYLGAVEAVL